jgi:hypothetical protein
LADCDINTVVSSNGIAAGIGVVSGCKIEAAVPMRISARADGHVAANVSRGIGLEPACNIDTVVVATGIRLESGGDVR